MTEVESNDTRDDIFFENDAGAITYNELVLHVNNSITPIKHTDIKKIYVTKERFLIWNYFFAVTFLIALYFALTSVSSFITSQFIVVNVISIIFLIAAGTLEVHRYKLCILTKKGFIKVKIKKKNKSSVQMLAYKMTQVKIYGFKSHKTYALLY